MQSLHTTKTYEFNSQEELEAFLLGVEESSGYMEYNIVDDPDLVVDQQWIEENGQ